MKKKGKAEAQSERAVLVAALEQVQAEEAKAKAAENEARRVSNEAEAVTEEARVKVRGAEQALDAHDLEQAKQAPLKAWERALLERVASGELKTIRRPWSSTRGDREKPRGDWNLSFHLQILGWLTIESAWAAGANKVALTEAGKAKLKEGK